MFDSLDPLAMMPRPAPGLRNARRTNPLSAIVGALIMVLSACHSDPHQGTGSNPTAESSSAPSARPLTLAQPSAGPGENPMVVYTDDVLSRYDAQAACLAVCSAALRCRVDALFSAGSPEVGKRLSGCRAQCTGEFPKRSGYLEEARSCLKSNDCGALEVCARAAMPPLTP
jgi:hypothetical protein